MATVASANTTAFAEGPITITKPSGLAENELLVAVISCLTSDTVATPSGWTNEGTVSGAGDVDLQARIFTKVADSSDVAASNFSFDVSDTVGSLGGTLMRVTSGDQYDAVGNSDTDTGYSSSGTGTNPQFTVSVTPTYDNALFVGVILSEDAYTFSSYSNNGTAITWTNRFNGNLVGDTCDVFTGTQATAAEITTLDVTESPDHGAGIEMDFGLFEIRSQVDATVTPAIVTQSSSVQAPTIATDTSVSLPSILTSSSTIQTPTVTADETYWSDINKSADVVSELDAMIMDGNNRVFMDDNNKIYRPESNEAWSLTSKS